MYTVHISCNVMGAQRRASLMDRGLYPERGIAGPSQGGLEFFQG